MKYVNINGVSFNADIISSWTKEEFLSHEMHNNHYNHLGVEGKKKALLEAWEILSKLGDGNSKSTNRAASKSKGKFTSDSSR